MILYWIFILLALSKLLGGKLSYLADVPLRGVAHLAWLVPLQFGVILATRQAIPALAGLLIIATYFGLLWICALNRRLPGGKFILAGMALNFLVITANGGVMPITQPVLESINRTYQVEVVSPTELNAPLSLSKAGLNLGGQAKLLALGDVIVVPLPGRFAAAFSIGDILIALGLARFCFYGTAVPVPSFFLAWTRRQGSYPRSR